MVYNVSAFVDNPEIAEVLNRCATLRNAALDICYDTPGYKEMPLNEKNAFFNSVFAKLASMTK